MESERAKVMFKSIRRYLVIRRARQIIKTEGSTYRFHKRSLTFYKKRRDATLEEWNSVGTEEGIRKDAYLIAERDFFRESPEMYWLRAELHHERLDTGLTSLLNQHREIVGQAYNQLEKWRNKCR